MKCVCCKKIELSKNHRKDTCQGCRRVFWYWERPSKGLPAIILRAAQLNTWQARMEYLAEEKDPVRFRKALKHLPANQGVRNGRS